MPESGGRPLSARGQRAILVRIRYQIGAKVEIDDHECTTVRFEPAESPQPQWVVLYRGDIEVIRYNIAHIAFVRIETKAE